MAGEKKRRQVQGDTTEAKKMMMMKQKKNEEERNDVRSPPDNNKNKNKSEDAGRNSTKKETNTSATSTTKVAAPEKKNKNKKMGRDDDDAPAAAESAGAEACSFPMRRVWRLIRFEGGNANINARTTPDAVFLINKASEMFLEKMAEAAYASLKKARRENVNYKDLSHIVNNEKRYEFLSDFVPQKVKAEDALKKQEM